MQTEILFTGNLAQPLEFQGKPLKLGQQNRATKSGDQSSVENQTME